MIAGWWGMCSVVGYSFPSHVVCTGYSRKGVSEWRPNLLCAWNVFFECKHWQLFHWCPFLRSEKAAWWPPAQSECWHRVTTAVYSHVPDRSQSWSLGSLWWKCGKWGPFEALVMGLLQSESSLSAGAADTQHPTTAWTGAYVAPNLLLFASAATLLWLSPNAPLLPLGLNRFSLESQEEKNILFWLSLQSSCFVSTCHSTDKLSNKKKSTLCARVNILTSLSSITVCVAL